MALASIQITQGAIVGSNGESVIGLDTTTAITLTDSGGAGASSYNWEVISYPGPSASPPTITNSTTQIATITPTPSLRDGVYIIRLTRTDIVSGVTTDTKFFAVEDEDGNSLPSSGMTGTMTNVLGSSDAQQAGWFGRESAATNVFLDAYLRLRKAREGRYSDRHNAITHSSGSPVTTAFVYGTARGTQVLTLTGAGAYTAELSLTSAESGAVFRFLVSTASGAGTFTLKNGVGGSTLTSISSPPSGSIVYELLASFDGTNWRLGGPSIADVKSLNRFQVLTAVAGPASNSYSSYSAIGTVIVDPATYPTSQVKFEAELETSDSGNTASIRLYNVTLGSEVASSTLTTTSITPTTVTGTITLASGSNRYEVQIKLASTDLIERALCSNARIVLTWG